MRTPHCVSLYSLLSRRSGGQTQSTASHCTMYWGHWDGLQEYHSLVFYNKFKGSFIIDYDKLGVLHQTDRPSQDLVNSFRSSSIGCIIIQQLVQQIFFFSNYIIFSEGESQGRLSRTNMLRRKHNHCNVQMFPYQPQTVS